MPPPRAHARTDFRIEASGIDNDALSEIELLLYSRPVDVVTSKHPDIIDECRRLTNGGFLEYEDNLP